jgi:hypothetical protein
MGCCASESKPKKTQDYTTEKIQDYKVEKTQKIEPRDDDAKRR